ncbi:hypothetical protein F5B18DRAFT_651063 [Nemania serpens]|nr:hypothetical protein F5B18DRAFT_651063 [Nemania serpens]
MAAAFTFGSLGDIVQLSQIAIQLGRAIGFGRAAIGESAAEYQEIRNDLDIFVVVTYEQHEPSAYLEVLDRVSRSVVDQCASHIQDALNHFQSRYQNSLHRGGSGEKIKDVFKKSRMDQEREGPAAMSTREMARRHPKAVTMHASYSSVLLTMFLMILMR